MDDIKFLHHSTCSQGSNKIQYRGLTRFQPPQLNKNSQDYFEWQMAPSQHFFISHARSFAAVSQQGQDYRSQAIKPSQFLLVEAKKCSNHGTQLANKCSTEHCLLTIFVLPVRCPMCVFNFSQLFQFFLPHVIFTSKRYAWFDVLFGASDECWSMKGQ